MPASKARWITSSRSLVYEPDVMWQCVSNSISAPGFPAPCRRRRDLQVAVAVGGCQNHALRFDAAQLHGLQVRHDDDALADEVLRFVVLGNAADDLARFRAEVDLQLQEFFRLGNLIAGDDLADAQIYAPKSSMEISGFVGSCAAGQAWAAFLAASSSAISSFKSYRGKRALPLQTFVPAG